MSNCVFLPIQTQILLKVVLVSCTARPKPNAVIMIGADGFMETASKEFLAVFQYFGAITVKTLG